MEKRKNKIDVRNLIIFLLVVILIIFGVFYFLGIPPMDRMGAINESGQLSEKQVNRVVKNLSDNILIPAEEPPFVFQVSDADLLRSSQSFYQNVEDGQYLLLFQDISLAVLYDLKKDLVINVGPIQLPPEARTSPIVSPVEDVTANEEDEADAQ